MNDKFQKLSDIKFPKIPNFEIPVIQTQPLYSFPTLEEFEPTFSTYEEDCPAINICKAVKEECRKGAEMYLNSRCSGAEVHSVLTKYNNQTINFNGNVTQFSPGDNTQLTILNQLPPELIEELVKLLNSKETDKAGWISWFNKAATVIGDLAPLMATLLSL